MKSKREFSDYLQDVVDAIEKIEKFTTDLNYDQFVEDDKTVFAVVRALEIIGEATKKIPQSFKTNYPNIPWREMTGMRDKLIHEYFGISLAVLWKTVIQDIPALKLMMATICREVNNKK